MLFEGSEIGNVLIIVFATVNGTNHTTRVILSPSECRSLCICFGAVCMSDECFTCTHTSTANRKKKPKEQTMAEINVRSVHNYGVNVFSLLRLLLFHCKEMYLFDDHIIMNGTIRTAAYTTANSLLSEQYVQFTALVTAILVLVQRIV